MVLWMEMNLIVFPIEEKATAGDQTAASIYKKGTGTFLPLKISDCRGSIHRTPIGKSGRHKCRPYIFQIQRFKR